MDRPPRISKQTRLLLQELLSAPQAWRHGYDLSQETQIKSGTLYPLLMRLEEQGFLQSRWDEPEREGRPPRHAYRLTTTGVALARALRKPSLLSKLTLKPA
jgi:PadR family transcriptional regulator, regulatory protein PadR